MEATAAERSAQLEWERRWGWPAGLAALGALLLPVVAQVVAGVVAGEQARDPVQQLVLAAERRSAVVTVGAMQVLGLLLLIGPLVFLTRAIRFRRPATLAGALPIVVVGTLASAGASAFGLFASIQVTSDFVEAGPRTAQRARELTVEALGPQSAVGQVALGARVAFGLALVLTGISAMRAGLISRFLGILGAVAGAMIVLFGFGGAFLLFFWAGAVALVLLDRWPGGRGPAWETGEATPWPSAAEQRAQTIAEREGVAAEGREGARDGVAAGDATDPRGGADPGEDPAHRRPAQQARRKRKRRR